MDDIDSGGDTAEMPVSQDPEITAELTANLPKSGDADNEDFDDASFNPELTAGMPAAAGDITIETESGRIGTRKTKAS